MNTKFKLKLIGIIALAAIVGFTLTGCPTDDEGGDGGKGTRTDIAYTIEQVGGANKTDSDNGADSTGIQFNFTEAIDSLGLTAGDITVGGKAAIAADAVLDGSGKVWTLDIDVNGAGTATVSINKEGIDAQQRSVTVYKEGEIAPITYELTTTGSGPVTTGIVFTFSEPVSGLEAGDITITDDTGAVTTGTLTGSGKTWTLGITVFTAGNVKVSINKSGIDDGEQSVAVSKAPDITYELEQINGSDNYRDSEGILFTFNTYIDSLGLTADDFEVGGVAEKADAPLETWGTFQRMLRITVNHVGLATVRINKAGIEAAEKTVLVYKQGEQAPALCTVIWYLVGGEEGTGAYPTQVLQGEKLARPFPDPTKAGHVFAGWYTDNGLTNEYDFDSPTTTSNRYIYLYAKWWSPADLAPGGEANPIPLTADAWENGRSESGSVWYSFEVTSGETYSFWINKGYPEDSGDGSKTGSTSTYAFYNGAQIDSLSSHYTDNTWTTAKTYTATSDGTVKIRSGSNGTVALAYSAGNTRPVNNDPGVETNPIPLFENNWTSGEGSIVWYSFEVTNGQTYYVWANYQISAYYSDDTAIFTNQSAWNTASSFTATSSGTVKVKGSSREVAYTTINARPSSANDSPRTLSVTADGSAGGELTTQLTFTFDQYIAYFENADLTVNDIFLSGVSVTKGTLSKSGAVYTLLLTNVTQSGTLSVTVAKTGFNISGATQYVDIYYHPIILNSVTGTFNDAGTVTGALALTFSQPIPGLSADDINISGVTGVTKGNLSGSGPTYTLALNTNTVITGNLSVSVTKAGYPINGSPQTVPIYALSGAPNNPIPLLADTWVEGNIPPGQGYESVRNFYYTFPVTANTAYYVWWNDRVQGDNTKTGDVNVIARYSGTSSNIFYGIDSGWTTAQTFTATSNDTVTLIVGNRNYGNESNGTYAIAYTTTNGNPNADPRALNSVTANGSTTTTTTSLTLTFDQAIAGLNANDITLSGIPVTKGTLSGSGPQYTLGISGFTYGGTLSVSVSKQGFKVSGSPKEVTVYYHSTTPAFESVTADGSASQTTTQLTLTFSGAIANLNANDITLTGVSGVTKGTLTGSGPTYYLPLNNVTSSGTLSVAVSKPSYTISGSPQTAQIYYLAPTPVTFESVTAVPNATGSTTAALTLAFDKAIDGLTANDITLTGVTGVVKGALSGSGPSYTLPISGFTTGGNVSVAVAKSGYVVSGTPKTVTIVTPVNIPALQNVGTPASNGTARTAVTATAQYTGTIAWSPALTGGKFAANTAYTATITLTALTGFTFNGLENSFFTVANATTVNSSNNTGSSIRVTATFPTTGAAVPFEYKVYPSGQNMTNTRLIYRGGSQLSYSGTGPQAVINAIQADADGNDCKIEFLGPNGNAGTTLDITSDQQYTTPFYPPEFTGNWGTVTIAGGITTSLATAALSGGTITISGSVSAIITANISNTAATGNAIRFNSTGTLTVNSGTISATTGSAIYQNGTGTITINGGAISATTGNAIYSANTGAITVTGASTSVTSANTTATSGTIYVAASGTGTGTRLTVNNGTVQNTAAGGNALYNASTGTVYVSGSGKATATTGSAIYNSGNGLISVSGSSQVTSANAATNSGTIHLAVSSGTGNRLYISGGTVQNTASGNAVYNYGNGPLNITGGAITTGSSAFAIFNENAVSMINLGGSPTVTGFIRPGAPGMLTALRTGDTPLNPSGKTYNLDYAALAANEIAVVNGGSVSGTTFLSNFTCRVGSATITLRGSGGNLIR